MWVAAGLADPAPLGSVLTAGLDFTQILMINNMYQQKPKMPIIPGGECVGTVKVAGADSGVEVGDLVYSSTNTGGFADEIVVPGKALMVLPADIDITNLPSFYGCECSSSLCCLQAAAHSDPTERPHRSNCADGTSIHALRDRANLQPGEKLLVLGAAGGIGVTAIELGKMWGAHVIAAASSDEKLELCKRLGADEVINYSTHTICGRSSRRSRAAWTWSTTRSATSTRSRASGRWRGAGGTS